ncbi:MAG TPA: hypothetical protein VEX43_15390 [Chthoniobacterales bacterium]|nr:hypothetical protein [Chthoniobacterales bacterium]
MTYSELDDLKSTWQTLSRNLERQNALTFHQLKESKFTRFRSGFRWLVVGQVLQIICGVLLTIVSARFWINHLGVPHAMIYGISLHVYGIMLIIFAARDLALIHRLDYAAPVLELQKQIAELRQWHLRTALWFGITGCFIWIPLILAFAYSLGADIWVRNRGAIGWLVLSGLVPAALLVGVVLWSRRPGKTKLARILEESSVGRSVNRAQALLDEIAQFERE